MESNREALVKAEAAVVQQQAETKKFEDAEEARMQKEIREAQARLDAIRQSK